MKALRSHAAGGPETLTLDEVASPEPGPGQVRVRVKACSVNFPDVRIIPGPFNPTPATPAQMVWLHQHAIRREDAVVLDHGGSEPDPPHQQGCQR